jgi:tRNA dimethylallyltransferase
MNKLLVICGPTATGKTDLGIKLARKFNGEIVSADSRQAYRGMDIGTGKDLPVNSKFEILNPKQIPNPKSQIPNSRIGYYEINGIRTWLYDVVEPDYKFNVADYVRCADTVINDIWKRGKLPIMVGGTGFYIKAIIEGIQTAGVRPDWKLRKQLDGWTARQLGSLLGELNSGRWERMNESDRKNPRRLVRAIEIALQIRNSKSPLRPRSEASEIRNKSKIQNPKSIIYNPLFVGLTAPYGVLYERIDKRVEERVKQGIINEIKGLLKRGYNWENSTLETTIGYKEWRECLKDAKMQRCKDAKIKEVIQRWKYDEHAYARRQMTWFRKTLRGNQGYWFDISEKGWENRLRNLVSQWHDAKN